MECGWEAGRVKQTNTGIELKRSSSIKTSLRTKKTNVGTFNLLDLCEDC